MVVEDVKESFHQPMPSGIYLRQIADIFKRIGTIASSATADFDLCQYMVTAFEDGDFHLGHHLFQIDGQKETCCSASNNRCLHRMNTVFIIRGDKARRE
jgi:hypothetical protein